MAKDERLYMTFPNDMHRHPKIKRLPVETRWTFIEIVAQRTASGVMAFPCTWPDEQIALLERAGIVRREADLVFLVENGMWGVVHPYRSPIDPRLRESIYERDGYRCRMCGATEPLQIDHIFPWSMGGTDEPSNLQTLCAPCNQSKGAKI